MSEQVRKFAETFRRKTSQYIEPSNVALKKCKAKLKQVSSLHCDMNKICSHWKCTMYKTNFLLTVANL